MMGQQPRPAEPSTWSWMSQATSDGESGDLHQVIDYMLVAAFESFPHASGRRVKSELSQNDRRVRELRAQVEPLGSGVGNRCPTG